MKLRKRSLQRRPLPQTAAYPNACLEPCSPGCRIIAIPFSLSPPPMTSPLSPGTDAQRAVRRSFFVDLPNAAAREQILKIHLQRRKRNPEQFDPSFSRSDRRVNSPVRNSNRLLCLACLPLFLITPNLKIATLLPKFKNKTTGHFNGRTHHRITPLGKEPLCLRRLDCVQFYCSVSKAIWTEYIRLRHAMVKCDAL